MNLLKKLKLNDYERKEELVIVKKFTYNDKEEFAVQQKARNGYYYTAIIMIKGKVYLLYMIKKMMLKECVIY